MNKTCPECKKKFEGEDWQKICKPCFARQQKAAGMYKKPEKAPDSAPHSATLPSNDEASMAVAISKLADSINHFAQVLGSGK